MKKISFLMAALLVAMVGCQKEPQATPDGNDVNAKGYVSVNIKLPSTLDTRANDDFNDGDENEWFVRNITLVFYDESNNYVWHTGVTTDWNTDAVEDNNITSTTNTGAIPVTQTTIKKVLVLLNTGSVITEEMYKDKPFDNFNVALQKASSLISASNNFFMTNVPYYNDDKSAYESLYEVRLGKTEAEAIANAHALPKVQVERAAAKVQVKYTDADGNENATGVYTVGDDEATVTLTGWNLDVTNKSFFPVRKYGLEADGWFPTGNAVNSGLIGLSGRVYYAIDPNYTGEIEEGSFTPAELTTLTNANKAIAYCHENTFAISNQRQNQSTRVLLAAKYQPKGFDADQTWYQVGTAKTIYNATDLLTYINTTLINHGHSQTLDALPTETAGEVTLKAGEVDINALIGKVYCYKDGVCYYPVIIRHFNHEEIDYTSESEFNGTYETAKGVYAAKDLGRYGVVRNNWYVLSIKKITGPGSPDYPTPGNENDDEIEMFVSTDILITPWCLREQGVIL